MGTEIRICALKELEDFLATLTPKNQKIKGRSVSKIARGFFGYSVTEN